MTYPQLSGNTIKAVIFDFGGTLYEISNEMINIWKRSLNNENICFNKKKFILGLLKARNYLDVEMAKRIKYMQNPVLSQNDWVNYNKLILDSLDVKGIDFDKLNIAITKEIFSMEFKYEIINDVKECLLILNDNYVLGVISNVSSDIRKYFIKDDIIDFFDFIGLSYELGAWKPDPVIFKKCYEKIKIKPSNILFIGDSLLCDVKASSNAGMHSLFIDYHNTPNDICKINKIGDLINIL